MNAVYWQKGETLDYTPEEAVSFGSVVNLTTRIGIAAEDIPANTKGSVQMEGVFALTKAPGESIALGAAVYYVAESDHITATQGANVPAGYAVQKTETEETTVLVKLLG